MHWQPFCFLGALAFLWSACSCHQTPSRLPTTSEARPALSTVTLVAENGQPYTFQVELALTAAEHARGLMERPEMAPDHGMLFVFDDNLIRTFWMKNTLIPLDMLFIDQAGKILGIIHEAEPLTTTSRSIHQPSKYVLELNGGTCKKLHITAGSFAKLPD